MSHPLFTLCSSTGRVTALLWLRLFGLLFFLGGSPQAAWAAFGIFQDYAAVNPNNTGFTFYAGGANAFNAPLFQNQAFGAFTAGQTLLLGSEIQTFKNGNSNVTGARLFYRVYLTGSPSGAFIQMDPFFSDNINGTGDQRWTNVNNRRGAAFNQPAPVDLLVNLGTGNYTLEVYWTAQASGEDDVVENKANANYQATFSYTAAPMPVTLTAFTAQRQGTDAILSWTTANETNNAGYEVQASTGGQTFQKLGFVAPAAASSTTTHSYTFRATEANKAGLRYYRLRQVDLDGSNTFSPVRTVQFEALTAASLAATPNPFSGSLTLNLELPQASPVAMLVLTDALGRVVLHQDLGSLPAGSSQTTLAQASQLPAGVYVARLVLATGTRLTKIVKQ